jgi:hypothetical protein
MEFFAKVYTHPDKLVIWKNPKVCKSSINLGWLKHGTPTPLFPFRIMQINKEWDGVGVGGVGVSIDDPEMQLKEKLIKN